jgi:hypothetical protein
MFSQKNIEDNQGQPVNKVEVNNGEEYNKRVEEEANKLGQQNDVEQDQSDTDLCQPLMRSGQLHNQPTVEVISREVGNTRFVDQTVIAKRINNDSIRDGKMMIRTVGNDRNFTVCSVVTGNATNKQEGFATAMGFLCNIVEDGIDLQFGYSVRTGADKSQAIEHLKQSESAQTLLSGDSGILSIEQLDKSQQKQ